MIKTVLCSTLALVAGSAIVCYADAKDDAVAAADKLASGGNYSWKTSVENAGGGGGGGRGGFGGGNQEGKTANGVTAITIQFGDNSRTIYRKGDKTVMQNQDGEWMTAEEMAAARGGGQGGGQGRRGNRGGGPGGGMLPADLLKDMISKTKSLTLADGVYSGELTEDAAKAAMTFGGRGGRRGGGGGGGGGNAPQVTDAKASLKVWVSNGVVSKYTSHVTGKTTNRNGDEINIDRTATTEFSEVGSTKVDVPADAAKKLG
jgi:hypothetical protein